MKVCLRKNSWNISKRVENLLYSPREKIMSDRLIRDRSTLTLTPNFDETQSEEIFNCVQRITYEWYIEIVPIKTLDEICPVCIEDFHIGENVCHLPCKHVFHINCIWKWIQQELLHSVCPLCKAKITAPRTYTVLWWTTRFDRFCRHHCFLSHLRQMSDW